MSKVVPLKIDTGLGKVKPKDRGLDMVEFANNDELRSCLLYTSPSPRDVEESRMPSSA